MNQDLQSMMEYLKEAEAILIAVGAGMGVDSGLPDFRGNEGFWKAYPPIKELGLSFEEMANPTWFHTNPQLAWAFYGHRLNLYKNTTPHLGYKLLLDFVQTKDENYFIFTSNVDGHFEKVGFEKDKIFEVHGSINHLQCLQNCKDKIWKIDRGIEVDMKKFEAIDIPLCPDCKDIARPNILMFGDWTWNSKRADKQKQRYELWKEKNKDKKIAILEIGAGVAVQTVRYETEYIARYHKDAKLIRINPRDYDINSNIGWSLPYGGLEGIKKILNK